MILGHLFLLIVLLIIILLVVAYVHYKCKLNQYKRRGYWDLSDIKYLGSVLEVLGYFIIIVVIVFLLYIVITNWSVPIL